MKALEHVKSMHVHNCCVDTKLSTFSVKGNNKPSKQWNGGNRKACASVNHRNLHITKNRLTINRRQFM